MATTFGAAPAPATSSRARSSFASSDAVRRRMQDQPRRDTSCELRLRSELHSRGFRYRVDARPLHDWRRRADLVFPSARVAVFVDGCFWHSCPEHGCLPKRNTEWWEAKLERTSARDRDTDRRLTAAGWTVVRVWEHEHAVTAAERVARVVEAGTSSRRRQSST